MKKRVLAWILVMVTLLSLNRMAATSTAATQMNKTADSAKKSAYTYSVDEFLLVGLEKAGKTLTSTQKNAYARTVQDALKSTGGKLDTRMYTVYSRTIIGLTALGYDATAFNGYDLTVALRDVQTTVKQGINGCIWALIALDSGEYPIGSGIRGQYLDEILDRELSGGGFALSGVNADPDVTAMALVALSRYASRSDVTAVIKRGLSKLSALQQSDGTYKSYGTANAESTAQVIIALQANGIALTDKRFVKNGKSALDGLLRFALSDGSFAHIVGGDTNTLATQQALVALAAVNGKGNPYSFQKTTFSDMVNHEAREAASELSRIGVLNGFPGGTFRPDETMTRAQFAATVVRALGLKEKKVTKFADVASNAWYAGYVGAAFSAGIIQGRTATRFDPNGTITVVEAQIMLARAAKTLGVSRKTPTWTANSPKILRGEIALEVYALMGEAGKL